MTFQPAIAKADEASTRQGYLDAMSIVSKMVQKTGHPVETETLDRVFDLLQSEYIKKWK